MSKDSGDAEEDWERLGKADIHENTRHPVLLYGKHYLTLFVQKECFMVVSWTTSGDDGGWSIC